MTQPDASAPQPHREVIVFGVAGQDYCFDIMSVREIRGWTDTTALPYAQDYMKGVINLRGAVVPVIDLSARLGLGATDPTHRHVIIIAVVSGKTIGLLADVVSDILKIGSDMEHPVPDVVPEEVLSCISGVILVEDRMIRDLDLEFVVSMQPAEAA